jgi:CheY-like chemotaxis protein
MAPTDTLPTVLLAMRKGEARDMAGAVLVNMGYSVTVTESAQGAIAQMNGTPPAMVITREDLADGFDAGLSVVRHVKTHYNSVPVAILSSNTEKSHLTFAGDVHRYHDDIFDHSTVAPLMQRIVADLGDKSRSK